MATTANFLEIDVPGNPRSTRSIAIITGATCDIGRAISLRLSDGHDVVMLADLDGEAAGKLARDLGDVCLPVDCGAGSPPARPSLPATFTQSSHY